MKDTIEAKRQILTTTRDTLERAIAQLIVTEGISLNQTAQLLGTTVPRIINWAKRNNIPYKRRPRIESPSLLGNLEDLIDQGASREMMATKLGVRRRWITSFFSRNPDAGIRWQKARFANETDRRRKEFVEMLRRHPGVHLGALQTIPGNSIQWLKRHDREWLRSHLPVVH